MPGRPTSRASHVGLRCCLRVALAVCLVGLAGTAPAQTVPPGVTIGGPLPGPLPLLPADNWWNTDISQAPVDPNSTQFIAWINNGGSRRLHPDWGGDSGDPNYPIYGMPFVVVPGTQALEPVVFGYDDESDAGAPGRPPGYPIPIEARTQPRWIEGGVAGGGTNGDRHMLIVDRDHRFLFELYALGWNSTLNRWEAGSGAVWPLDSNLRRPDTWTSADAAGLAILPGLVRYDEVYGPNPIEHAFRVTTRSTNGYVFPASHRAGSTAGAPPMGTRFRLKASVNLAAFPADVRKVLQAMKTYGLIVADNGSDMYITGTNDARWDMNVFVPAFRLVSASDFEVVQLGWQPPTPPADGDGDGLPDAWETQFGLNPADATGDNGATGDPDGDGVTNAGERAAGTHPRGFVTRYFAEGATGPDFDTHFALLNPGTQTAHVLLRYLRSDGTVVPDVVQVDSHYRTTKDPELLPGLQQAAFSLVIESDEVVVADRTMLWDARGFGAHAETALRAPASRWYLAEGATHSGFQLFYLLQNPGTQPSQIQITYLLPSGSPLVSTRSLPPLSRTTIWVNLEPGLSATDVSAVVDVLAGPQIIVERAMYRDARGRAFDAGHAGAGVTQAVTSWFVAEGATGAWFDAFLLVANPGASTANVQVRFQLPNGTTETHTLNVPPTSRRSLWVDTLSPTLANTAFSAVVTSTNGVPVVVERAMWWPGPTPADWYEAHDAAAASESGVSWAFAEGEVDATRGIDTFLLIANTAVQPGSALVTLYFDDGTSVSRTYPLPGTSRTSVWVLADFPAAAGRTFGAVVTSLGASAVPIVAERAMYYSLDGTRWSAGTSALGAKLR